VREPSKIQWMSLPTRLEKESETYMTLSEAKKTEKTMAKVREQMRKQGLYVARERVLLPGNVERAIQRVRIRKARAAKAGGEVSADGAAVVNVGEAADPNNFSPEEERFLVPFDPLKERFSRPAMRYDPYMPYLQYNMLVPATNLDLVFGAAEPSKLLDIEIRKLTFTDHPYFCEEDYLAAQLEGLGRKYKQRAEMNWVGFYTQKIEDAKAALDIVVKERELTSGGDAAKPDAKKAAAGKDGKDEAAALDKEPELRQELGRLRLLRASEEYEDLSIVSSMIRLWEKVKGVRKRQGFISTKIDLKFKRQKMDAKTDLANREEELEAEMAEVRQLHQHAFRLREMAFLENKAKVEATIKRRKARVRELEDRIAAANMAEGSDEDASDDDDDEGEKGGSKPVTTSGPDARLKEVLDKDKDNETQALEAAEELLQALTKKQPKIEDEPLDEEAERQRILARQAKTKRAPGDPVYLPILTNRTQKTEMDALPDGKVGKEEEQRRKKIKNLQFVMKVSVNGFKLRDEDGQVCPLLQAAPLLRVLHLPLLASRRVTSRLIPSHLIPSHPIPSHLISALISSHLISALIPSPLLSSLAQNTRQVREIKLQQRPGTD